MPSAAVRLLSSRIGRRTQQTAVPWVIVPDARAAMAALAAEFYGHPSRSMQVVGITGTNGKTTTAYLLRAVFESAGKKCGLLGTVTYSVGDQELPAARTTPEAPDVQRMFRQMVDAGCRACVMEVSSHALALRRVDDTAFAAAVFTNLTRDHLDYHGDMESYFAAKRRLFDMLPPGAPAVINLDDPRGDSLRKAVSTPVTYAINKPADVTPGPLTLTFEGLEFDARTPKGDVHVKSRLVGRPNVSNILATVAVATALDVPIGRDRAAGWRSLGGVPGTVRARVERQGRHHRRDRLRPHGRRAQEPARNSASAGAAPRHYRVRLRRRSRSHEAAADGRGGRAGSATSS